MKQQQGFTLVELVIVIVVLGILAAVAVPKFVNLGSDAEKGAASAVAGALASATSINFAAKKVGNSSAVAINQGEDALCKAANSNLTGLLQGGLGTATLSGDGDCSGSQETAACTVTVGEGTATATIVCAR